MADNLLKDVQKVIKDKPGFSQLDVYNALKGKYGERELGQVIASEFAKKPTQQQIAQNQIPADVNYLDSTNLIKQIISEAGNVSDPTATTTVSPPLISPLTGAPIGQVQGQGTAGLVYGNASYASDFQGGGLVYNYDPKLKQHYISRKGTAGNQVEVAILGDPNNPGNYIATDFSTAVKAIVQDAIKSKGGVAALKQTMWRQGKLTGNKGKASIASGNQLDDTFLDAIMRYVRQATFDNYYAGASGLRQFRDFNSTVSGTQGYAGTRTSTSYEFTPKQVAAQEISSFTQQYLGVGATAKQIADYEAQLAALEKASPTRTTTTKDALDNVRSSSTIRGGVTQDQKTALMTAIISKQLTAKGVDPESISKSGGLIARSMDVLKQTAADYGIRMDSSMALSRAVASIQPGADIKGQQEILKQLAKTQYKHLAGAIDSGVTIKDIADQFNYYKNKTLETVSPVDVFDPDIQAALTGDGNKIMSLNDFLVKMKSKPEWAMTQNAREEASNYATTILRNFGLIG